MSIPFIFLLHAEMNHQGAYPQFKSKIFQWNLSVECSLRPVNLEIDQFEASSHATNVATQAFGRLKPPGSNHPGEM